MLRRYLHQSARRSATKGRSASSTTLPPSDSAGPHRARVVGTTGRIEIDRVWHAPTTFRISDSANTLIETFGGAVAGRGMPLQAEEAERLTAGGLTTGQIMPPAQSVEIMRVLDAVRAQIGLRYPGER